MSIVDRHQLALEAVATVLASSAPRREDVHAAAALLDEVVTETSRELRRCAEWIDHGLIVEAVAHARSSHELVRRGAELLATSARPEWLAARAAAGASHGSTPDATALAKLNASFPRVRGILDPLRAMRLVFLRRESPARQIAAVQAIANADPRNGHWSRLAESLEDEAMTSLAADAEAAMASGDLAGVNSALELLSSRRWSSAVPPRLRERLQQRLDGLRRESSDRRFDQIADSVHEAMAAMDRAAIESLESQWTALVESGSRPPPRALELVASCFDWLDSLREGEREAARREAARADLERALDERREPDVVERLAAVVLSAEGELPPGLAGRVESVRQRETSRRRRRILLASSTGVAVVAAVAAGVAFVVMLLRERSIAERWTSEIAALVSSGSPLEAAELAREVREDRPSLLADHPDLSAAVATALEAEQAELARRRRLAEVVASSEQLLSTEELGIPAIDSAIADLDDARQDARLSEEESLIELLRRRWQERRDDRLMEEVTAFRLLAAELAEKLGEIAAPSALDDRSSLPEVLAALEELEATIADELEATEHLGPEQEILESLMLELRSRRSEWEEHVESADAFAAAVAAVGDSASSEASHLEAYRSLLRGHGARLQAAGTLGDHEVGERWAKAAVAVAHWREVVWPAAAPNFQTGDDWYPRDHAAATRLASLLDEHVAAHPLTPYRAAAESLRTECLALSSLGAADQSMAALVESRLLASGLADLWIIRTRNGVRYGRGFENARVQGAVQSLADLAKPISALKAPLVDPSTVIGTPEPTEAMALLEEFRVRLAAIPPSKIESELVELFQRALDIRFEEPGMQLQVLRTVASLVSEMFPSSEAGVAMQRWLTHLRNDRADGLRYDWIVVGQGASDRNRSESRRAFLLAMDSPPDAKALAARSRQSRAEASSRLIPLALGGVLTAPNPSGTRSLVGPGERRIEFWTVVSAPGSDQPMLGRGQVVDGVVIPPRPLPPPVPVLFFVR